MTNKEILNIDIDVLGLSLATNLGLKQSGIKTFRDLLIYDPETLRERWGIGKKNYSQIVAEVNNCLENNGINDFTFPLPKGKSLDPPFFYQRWRWGPGLDEIKLEELELSLSSYIWLRRCGLRTVQELYGVTSSELRAIVGIDERAYCEIVSAVRQFLKEAGIFDIVFPHLWQDYDPIRDEEYDIARELIGYVGGMPPELYATLKEHGYDTVGQLLEKSDRYSNRWVTSFETLKKARDIAYNERQYLPFYLRRHFYGSKIRIL